MTVMTSVEDYLQAVSAALSDLDPDIRADLLEDLPSHLAEVAAEGDASLVDRLGDPVEYAAELRAAAGLAEDVERGPSARDQLAQLVGSTVVVLERADIVGGRLLGYPRLGDCLRALRPGWWVVRGCLVAWLVAFNYGNRNGGAIPNFGNGYSDSSKAFGLIFLSCCVLASIRIGRASERWSIGARRALLVVGILLAVFGLRTAEPTTRYAFDFSSSSADFVPVSSGSASAAATAAAAAAAPADRASLGDGVSIENGSSFEQDPLATPAASAEPTP